MSRPAHALLLAGTLLIPTTSLAAETPAEELRQLARCAIGSGAYKTITGPKGWAQAPAEAKALTARMAAVEDALMRRVDQLSAGMDQAAFDVATKPAVVEMHGVIDSAKDDAEAEHRAGLAYYRPVLEACVTRGEALGG